MRNFNVVQAALRHGGENGSVPAPKILARAPNQDVASSSIPETVSNRPPDERKPTALPATHGVTKVDIQAGSITQTVDASEASRNRSLYHIDLPPPTVLFYDVKALKRGVPHYGQSNIDWQVDGAQYRIIGTTEIDGMATRSFQSEGTLDEIGIAPLLYSEKSSNKSATNTHFQRERNIISFSSSTASYPRRGGEQDRASIIWQLAGIGRGSPEKFSPDAEFTIFVAGVRDGESWRIRVLNEEEIEIAAGKINAWHLVRMPRPGTYDQRLDLWLAPQQAWYPVKWRFTQANGDTVEMSLAKVSNGVH